jgi:AcrR family transcriptional regulator
MYDVSREPLTRDRILRSALAVADEGGLPGLTIRSLAQRLGTKPMSVYHYVANKDDILDGLVDLVFAEIELPEATGDWRAQMTRRARSAIEVLGRHSWSIGLLESRTTPGPATLKHHDATIAALRAGGFSIVQTAHAYAVLDAYTYGFAVQLSSLPFEGPDGAADVAESIVAAMAAGEYPHLAEFADQHALQPGYDFADEFGFGLELILDGLARMVER